MITSDRRSARTRKTTILVALGFHQWKYGQLPGCRWHAPHPGRMPGMTRQPITRAVVIADEVTAKALSKDLEEVGVKVAATMEDVLEEVDWRSLMTDILIMRVSRGSEMRAYRIGNAAADQGIVTLLVVDDRAALAVGSLANALPGSIIVELPLRQDPLDRALAEALRAREFGRTDARR